jgi:hypothetical protein
MPQAPHEYNPLPNGTGTHAMQTPLAAYELWETSTPFEKLDYILHNPRLNEWLDDESLQVLVLFYDHPAQWAKIRQAYRGFRGNPDDLEHVVKALIALAPIRGDQAVIVQGISIEDEDIAWLWEPYIAKKSLTILDGDPGVGKTMFACQLAANVSRGYPVPDQAGRMAMGTREPANVLLMGMEDHLGSVVKKRLDHCGADLERIAVCNDVVNAQGEPRPFTLSDLPLLMRYMDTYHPALVYIDAIQGVLGDKIDIGSPNKVKALLVPLARMAEAYDCAIVCARHPSKPGQNVPRLIHRGMGSQSFIGSARSGLFVEQDPGDSTRSLLVHYKSNMGELGRTQLFSKAQGHFEWCGASRVTEAVLSGAGRGPNPYALLEACFWLERQLADGAPHPSTDLEAAAETDDIAAGVLKRAKKILGVLSTQMLTDEHRGWYWTLPPLAIAPTTPTTATTPTTPTTPPGGESMTYEDGWGPLDQGGTVEDPPPEGAEDSEGVVGVVDAVGQEASAMVIPCVVCGGTKRWRDKDVWRCVACWPRGTCSTDDDPAEDSEESTP